MLISQFKENKCNFDVRNPKRVAFISSGGAFCNYCNAPPDEKNANSHKFSNNEIT